MRPRQSFVEPSVVVPPFEHRKGWGSLSLNGAKGGPARRRESSTEDEAFRSYPHNYAREARPVFAPPSALCLCLDPSLPNGLHERCVVALRLVRVLLAETRDCTVEYIALAEVTGNHCRVA